MRDKISVIIPVYNTGYLFEICLKSILDQTYSNIEIIIVNDGSTDSVTIKYLEEIKNSKIKIVHKKNGGAASARNTGIEYSMGEYIVFIDSDDKIDKHMLEKLYKKAIENNVKAIFCNYKIIENNNIKKIRKKIKENIYLKDKALFYFLSGYFHSACTGMYHKDVFNSLKFKEGIINEDFLFNFHVIKLLDKVYYLNEELYFYIKRDNSVTNQKLNNRTFDWIKNSLEIKNNIKENYQSKKLNKIANYQYLYANFILINKIILNSGNKMDKIETEHYFRLYKNIKKNLGTEWFFFNKRNKILILMLFLFPQIYFKFCHIITRRRK
ncbi:MAG: glycosyltransferase family 2 protein [Cetobacterium sp.]